MKYSPIRKLAPFAEKAKAKGLRVLGLNIGQPDIETPELFFETIRNYSEKVLKYSDSRGEKVLLDSFIRYYADLGFTFTHDELLVTNGGSEGLYFTLYAICNEGDEIIIPEPFYTNYSTFADLAGCKVVPLTTYVEEGFHLPGKEKIEALITERTRAIMITNPSNPTGTVYTEEEIRRLAEICKEHHLYLISDEVYREFIYDGAEFFSPLSLPEIANQVILIDSISKRYSACGARIGLIASKNVEVVSSIMKMAQARLCVPTLEQVAAAELYHTPRTYFTRVNEEYQNRRDVLYEGLKSIDGIKVKKPAGAFYLIAGFPVKSAEHFCQWMLENYSLQGATVMMAPAEGFYGTSGLGKNEIRLSYCINIQDLKLAVEILRHGLETYQQLNF